MSENDNRKAEKLVQEPEKAQETPSEDENQPAIKIWDGEWILRPCDMYKSEYKECKSIKGRFQQYYVHGEALDCSQWKRDYDNCRTWKKKEDETAYEQLLESEKKRRLQRLKGHVANNVWTPRNGPPADWDEPLPDWMVKKNKGTFLANKQREINEKGRDDEMDLYVPACSII